MDKIKLFLDKNRIEFCENFDLSQLSSIKIGDLAKIVIFPKNEKQLENIILFLMSKKIYFKVIGNASNILFVSAISYPLVVTSKMKDEIKICGEMVDASAGVMLPMLCDVLKANGLSGFEGISAIPATIGGALISGAGAFGCNIYDNLVEIKVVDRGNVCVVKKNEINFKHHYSNLNGIFVLSAKFLFEKKNEYDIMKKQGKFTFMRAKTQPSGLSLGCIYQKVQNKSAGFVIERSGLKGKKVGGIMVSNKHANFFINDGTGTLTDFLRLSALVESAVKEHFGVNLLPEIEKVGEKDETSCRLSYPFK